MDSAPRRILFVDDERSVLDGLRRLLRPYRKQWTVMVAESGDEGLDKLKEHPVDVVVSDMRMPKMDGAEFLGHVATQYPAAIRIVLTGQSSNEAFLRSIGTTHQVLTKPCDPEELVATLERAVALRARLTSPGLRELVSRIDHLPSLPSLYLELLEALRKEASVQDIGGLVAKDLAMSARILQLVNSAYFGLRNPVADPVQATTFLGVDLIRALTLSAHAFAEMGSAKGAGLNLTALQDHSHAVASLAARMMKDLECGSTAKDLAYMAGLLHETGRLVLAASEPEQMAEIMRDVRNGSGSLREKEFEQFGAGHAEVGGYLLGLWALPEDVVEAVTCHHDLGVFIGRSFSVGGAVYLADRIVSEALPNLSENDSGVVQPTVQEAATALGVQSNLEAWFEFVEDSQRSAA